MPPGEAQGGSTFLEVMHLPFTYQLKGPSRTDFAYSPSVRTSCPESLSPTSHLTKIFKEL